MCWFGSNQFSGLYAEVKSPVAFRPQVYIGKPQDSHLEDKQGKYNLAIGIWLLLQLLDEILTYCSGFVMECVHDLGE